MSNFAIIGAGEVAQSRYIPALNEHERASVTWIADVNEKRARRVADETGAREYTTDYLDALGTVDAVLLCTPPKYHEQIARDCIQAGVDILTEKPVALTGRQARSLIALSEEYGVEYAISRQYREAPACRLLKLLVQQGAVGSVEHVYARFGDETNWDFASAYRVSEQLAGGGVLSDKGPHILDIVRWILDTDLGVKRYADDSYGGLEANAELEMTVPDGDATAHLEITASRAITNGIRVVGKEGEMRAKPGGTRVRLETDRMEEITLITTDDPDPPTTSGERMAKQVNRFVESLDSNTVSYVPAETDIQIMNLIEHCYANRTQLDHSWEHVAVSGGGA